MISMKKIFLYTTISLLTLLMAGCEDYLDKREESDGIEEATVYSSYETIRGFLDNVYNKLDDWNWFENAGEGYFGRTYVGVMADEMAISFNKTVWGKFFSGAWLLTGKSENVTEIGNGDRTPIGRSYAALRIVNRVIENIDKVAMTDAQKSEILGQAYFYRAWFYFQIIKRYGGMPLVDKVFKGGDDDLPRLTYHESSDWMLGDIENAISMLPDAWDDMNYGRPTKLAAMAFKEIALLYDASPLMQNDLKSIENRGYDKDRAAKAAKAAWEAISYMKQKESVTGVRLETKDEYRNIFWFSDQQLKQPEHIWARRFIASTDPRSKTLRAFWLYPELATGTGSEAFAMACPTLNAVNMYERQGSDGNYYPIDDNRSGYSFDPEHAFVNRDPRFYNNILKPCDEWGTYQNGDPYYIRLWVDSKPYNDFLSSKHTNGRQISGFMCRKFLWEDASGQHAPSGNDKWLGYCAQTVYIRVAQLYLDLAEASFEATGSATAKVEGVGMSAEEAVNTIRNRVGVTNLTSDFVNSPDKFREAYRRERAVELMFENQRWWDVRRWMIMEDLFKEAYPLKGVKFHLVGSYKDRQKPEGFTYEKFDMIKEIRAFTRRNYWYPLPQHDVDALENLEQNPGW